MTDVATKLADAKMVRAATATATLTGDQTEGMSYLETLPRRLVTLYLPLSIILLVLLFPFYWMALTAIKPDAQLLDLDRVSPFWTWTPTIKHIQMLLFETKYPQWLWNTMFVAVSATFLSIVASVLAAYESWLLGNDSRCVAAGPIELFPEVATAPTRWEVLDMATGLPQKKNVAKGVAVTANAGVEETRNYFEAGMDAVVPKPVVPAVLYEAIATTLTATVGVDAISSV